MQLAKFYRRRRRHLLNVAMLNAAVQIGALCDEGWAAYGRVCLALGEFERLGGDVEELPLYDEYQRSLKALRRKAQKRL